MHTCREYGIFFTRLFLLCVSESKNNHDSNLLLLLDSEQENYATHTENRLGHSTSTLDIFTRQIIWWYASLHFDLSVFFGVHSSISACSLFVSDFSVTFVHFIFIRCLATWSISVRLSLSFSYFRFLLKVILE